MRDGGVASLIWDVEIVAEVANELIAWRSDGDGARDFEGTVRFFQGTSSVSTRVWLELAYRSGSTSDSLLGPNPDGQIHEDLRRFGDIMVADKGPGNSRR